MAKTVNLNTLTPDTIFMVRGNLTYCRVTSRIDGEQLRQKMENQRARGMMVIDKPHTTASIKNARVLYKNVDAYGRPVQKLPEEIYAEESLWVSKKNPQEGMNFTGYNKGTILPTIGVLQADGKTVQGINPEGELANDLDVTLVMKIFKPKNQINNGIALEGIIVNEPVRYYGRNDLSQTMQEMGMTWIAAPAKEEHTATEPAPTAPAAQAPINGPLPFEDGNGAGYMNPPSRPEGNPYSTTGQPVAQPNYAPPTGPVQNNAGPQPTEYRGYAGPEAAPTAEPNTAAGQPVRQAQPTYGAANNGGIHYTGADRQY